MGYAMALIAPFRPTRSLGKRLGATFTCINS